MGGGGVYSIVEWRRGEGGLNEKGGRTWAEGERDVNGKGGREGIKKWREEGKSEMEKGKKGVVLRPRTSCLYFLVICIFL